MLKMRRIVSLILTAVLLVTFAGCGKKTPQAENLPDPIPMDEPEDSVTVPQKEENLNIVTISTPYGELYYQEQWSEHMRVTQQEDSNYYMVAFAAEFNGMQYPLFELLIGEEVVDPVAKITDANGTKYDVGVNFLELREHPELAEDEQNQLYAMQEDINFVVANIK